MSSTPTPYNFSLSDQSPLFQYQPARDGPISSSWNVSYSGNQDSTWAPDTFVGAGISSHRTTLKGASVQIQWVGTAIYMFAVGSPGGYSIALDNTPIAGSQPPGANGLLFSQDGLSYGVHTVVLQVLGGEMSFNGATITAGVGANGAAVTTNDIPTITVPLTASGFSLSDTTSWSVGGNPYAFTGVSYNRINTDTAGSSITFTLSSVTAFSVLGSVNYNHGTFSVTLSPPPVPAYPQTNQYNGSSHWVALDQILYLATGLDRTQSYVVTIVDNMADFFDISKVVVYDVPPSAATSPPSPQGSKSASEHSNNSVVGPAIGGAVGGIVLIVLLIFALLLCRRRSRERSVTEMDRGAMQTSFDPNLLHGEHTQNLSQPGLPYGHSPTSPLFANEQRQSTLSNSQASAAPMMASANSDVFSASASWISGDGRPTSGIPSSFTSGSRRAEPLGLISSSHTGADIVSHRDSQSSALLTPSSPRTTTTSTTELTDEQAQFVRDLRNMNVPVAEIAGLMETMRREREAAAEAGSTRSDRTRAHPTTTTVEAPPSYDFKGLG